MIMEYIGWFFEKLETYKWQVAAFLFGLLTGGVLL
jgi:hypothetical protein